MKSALFVDFDNVYSGLRRLDPAVAERFAARPVAWIRWLTHTLTEPPPAANGPSLQLLMRRCHVNPRGMPLIARLGQGAYFFALKPSGTPFANCGGSTRVAALARACCCDIIFDLDSPI